MAYASQDDLLQRITEQELQQLTDDDKSGQVNAATVTAALSEATGIIDGYCRNRYQTPLQTSNMVTTICRDITIYLLYSRRPQKMKETARTGYTDALGLLKDVSAGRAQLDQPSGASTPQTATGDGVLPTSQNLRFTDCDLKGFV